MFQRESASHSSLERGYNLRLEDQAKYFLQDARCLQEYTLKTNPLSKKSITSFVLD